MCTRTAGQWKLIAITALALGWTAPAGAQQAEPTTREAAIAQEQADKATTLHPYVPGKAERIANRFEYVLTNGTPSWHPFLENAYSGGGFALGLGYAHHVSSYNLIDFRGSYSIAGYKRVEGEFVAPRMFNRRAALTLLGGWREATQVGFYGTGTQTSKDDRTNYDFEQSHASAMFTIKPTRKYLVLGAGLQLAQWKLNPGEGTSPSVETVYTPDTLPGLGTKTTYIHSQGSAGLDWRTSPGYARRGGLYHVTLHDFDDRDKEFGFNQVDYEVIQHIPILREAWVISLRGRVQTAFNKDDQRVPFFMLPALGGGSTLRGYSSWRFRDENSLLLQAEWRIMVNRFFDTTFFYDAGKVTARRSDLDFDQLKTDWGFGARFHGPFATLLRFDLARSREGLALVIATGPVF